VISALQRLPGIRRAEWILSPFVTSVVGLKGLVSPARLPLLAWRFGRVERFVACPHTVGELARVARAIAGPREERGAVVECGCFKGGSTARLSLVCAALDRSLVVFDSFSGLPEPEPWDARHRIGRSRTFVQGEYEGSLDEVRENVASYGCLHVCHFVPGWFAATMPLATPNEVVVAFIDADLVSSTRDALEHVWPRLVAGGTVFVHDTTDEKLSAFLDGWRVNARPARWGGLGTSLAWFGK